MYNQPQILVLSKFIDDYTGILISNVKLHLICLLTQMNSFLFLKNRPKY